ncbi:LPS translocon maturation chaperone LptM [Marinobacter sp.]|uniref:LPS translocon maturation chaperone LptM n=1 Tax=Marinobacter sp. TaxID=50741 RepID=UPI00356AD457
MQAALLRRAGYAALLLLAIFAVSGCGQKGPLYREAPRDVVVPAPEAERPQASDDYRQGEATMH